MGRADGLRVVSCSWRIPAHDHQDEWARRFARAAQLIAERLDAPPSLDELGRAAAISPFHFHRVWRAWTGEELAQSGLRILLEISRELLRGTSVTARISPLAYDCSGSPNQRQPRACRN